MRYIKFAVVGLLALYILLTLIGLMMPSSVTVGRSVAINAPLDSIHNYTHDLAKWREWINGADTAFYKQLTPTTSQKGSKVMLGTYTITILKIDADTLYTLWQGSSSKEQMNRLELLHDVKTGSTIVNWSFQQHLNWYPWERLSAMLYDKVWGPSMDASVAKLKQVCEK